MLNDNQQFFELLQQTMLYAMSTLQHSAVITDGPGRDTSPPDRADDLRASTFGI